MIAIIQRISYASVSVDNHLISECGKGIHILLGIALGDDEKDAQLLADKISKLRIFEDENGKMNLSVNDIGGQIMVVPNFTLLASYKKGNRPDFMNSAPPMEAEKLYEYFIEYMKSQTGDVLCGVFGAHMKVKIENDGPVTICMDSKVLRGNK